MKIAKNISFYIVIGIVFSLLGYYLKSDFIFTYLKDNIIGLQLTLLAINTATLGLIASKIQDIVIKFVELDFSQTTKEMKKSLLEQILLIIASIITLLIQNSETIVYEYKTDICNIFLIAIFIYSVNILWDTGKAVFIIIDEIQVFIRNQEDENKNE